jgi:hypothetical protein
MGKIVWLASYPKSGNTWMRTLLVNYLRHENTPADINHLGSGPIASARVWFDEWAGIEASQLSDEVVERLRPGVYACMARESSETIYMKVHDCWRRNDLGEPLFPAQVSAGVVYILRNPLDMAASMAGHYGVESQTAIDNLCDPDFALARSLGSLADQLRQPLGSWSGHVASWLDSSGLPVLLVRYEDLRREPDHFFGSVVRFLDLPFDEARVRKAVEFSSFEELKRQESEKGFDERSVKASQPFFRKGQTGAWRDELNQAQAAQIIAAHAALMRRFGYLDEYNQPL